MGLPGMSANEGGLFCEGGAPYLLCDMSPVEVKDLCHLMGAVKVSFRLLREY